MEVKNIDRQYFGSNTYPIIYRNANPFEDPYPVDNNIYLAICSREGCNKRETISYVSPDPRDIISGKAQITDKKMIINQFKRCPICMTKYCSSLCQQIDHREGKHKEKCAKYQECKKHCEKVLCPRCMKNKIGYISDPYTGGKKTKYYNPCTQCYVREMKLSSELPENVSSDKDINRIWMP